MGEQNNKGPYSEEEETEYPDFEDDLESEDELDEEYQEELELDNDF